MRWAITSPAKSTALTLAIPISSPRHFFLEHSGRFFEYARRSQLAGRFLMSALPGPIAGFIVALPLMAYAIAISKIVPGAQQNADIVFGHPPLMRIFMGMFHPGADPISAFASSDRAGGLGGIVCHGVEFACPVGSLMADIFCTASASKKHKEISLAVALGLIAMGIRWWHGWGAVGNRFAGAVAEISASAGV